MSSEGAAVGRLLICPTPIGNLEDITLRVMQALRDAEVIACEDTRRTRILLDRHGLGVGAELISYHEHNESQRVSGLIKRMRQGATVALVSDAGMPSISDPGLLLVRAAVAEGVPVEVLPGPSSVMVALVLSGLPVERFTFVGFLPRARVGQTILFDKTPHTLVAFESPKRLASTLQGLAELDPKREVAVCRELTKLHEEVLRGSASLLAAHYGKHPARGEVVLVVAGAGPGEADMRQALDVLHTLVEAGAKPRVAAGAVAKLTGLGANELYRELTSGA
jgi:16S rRNA (cytidine1402-2'-O)-methyltransferase